MALPNLKLNATKTEVDAGEVIEYVITREGDSEVACAVRWSVLPSETPGQDYAEPMSRVHNFDPGDVMGGFSVPTNEAVTEDGVLVIVLTDPLGCEVDPAAEEVTVAVLAKDDGEQPIEPPINPIDPPIEPPVVPPVEPPVTGSRPTLPKAKRTFVATSKMQLQNLLNTGSGNFDSAISVTPPADRDAPLRAGDHVVLKQGVGFDGIYDPIGAIVGTSDNPVIFRSESNDKRTKLKGMWKLYRPNLGVAYLSFDGGGVCVEVGAKGCWVHRNEFRDTSTSSAVVSVLKDKGPDTLINYNSFINIKGCAFEGMIGDATKSQGIIIDHNLIDGHSVIGDQESVGCFLTDQFRTHKLTYSNNLFRNCLKGATNQWELISTKTGYVDFIGNTIELCKGSFFSLRETRNCNVLRNYFSDGAHLKVYSDDHVIRGNHSTSVMARLWCGNAYLDSPDPAACSGYEKKGKCRIVLKKGGCNTAHCGVRNTLVENNGGIIKVGELAYPDAKFKCDDIILKNNAKAADRTAAGCGKITESGVGDYNQVARKLNAAQVGINA